MTADTKQRRRGLMRSRWAAIGAAVAVTVGAGGLYTAQAADDATSGFVAVAPTRILDTRGATNVGLENLFAGQTERTLQVTGAVPAVTSTDPFTVDTRTVVPDGATAVVMNVTGIRPSHNGFISVRPAGTEGTPSTSNLNVAAGAVTPNSVTVELSADGQVGIYFGSLPIASVNVAVDIVGYYTSTNFGEQITALESRIAALEGPLPGDDNPTTEPTTPVSASQTFPGSMVIADDAGETTFNGSCMYNERTSISYMPLTLPVGAAITQLDATIQLLDSSVGGESYSLSIGLEERTGAPLPIIRAITNDRFPTATFAATGRTLTVTPTTPVTVEADHSYQAALVVAPQSVIDDTPGLCNVTVTYTLPD